MVSMDENLQVLEEAKCILQSSLFLYNKQLIKVLVAINSSKDKAMIDDHIKSLTGLANEEFFRSIEILEKTEYIKPFMEDIPTGSIHKVYRLTERGKKLLKILKIE